MKPSALTDHNNMSLQSMDNRSKASDTGRSRTAGQVSRMKRLSALITGTLAAIVGGFAVLYLCGIYDGLATTMGRLATVTVFAYMYGLIFRHAIRSR